MRHPNPPPDTKVLTREQVQQEYGIPQHLLDPAAHDGAGPPRLKLGHRTVRFLRADVEAWLASRRVAPGRAEPRR